MNYWRHLLRLLPLAIMATSAQAWTFTAGDICKLEHHTAEVAVTLTYDPSKPLYSISLKRTVPFPSTPYFSLAFEGPAPLDIGTDRHVLSDAGTRLTVTDTGFGNVLNGLQFNTRMRATIGPKTLTVPLAGAADPVAAFRACEASLPSA